ncbi:hypothetical protein MGN70_010158 [Eutypa lata]|uniref:Uncharacterized protein n=1 Tax=Eutypa lata (strain UCR-EL1) TaxID=1287681 RepID=M7SSY6_EUTLA|nr:hypothetical protein UCREL1_5619 [Eutypa lata UCREL1]KAI1248955.1 hypothetical protein MGN70_010158 [Eutypa lata]
MQLAQETTRILSLTSAALANICYNHVQGNHKVDCVDKEQVSFAGAGYCGKYWDKLNGDWEDWNDSNGNLANFGKVSKFSSQEACEAAFKEIVDLCHEGWDGGSWAAQGVVLNVNFCKW